MSNLQNTFLRGWIDITPMAIGAAPFGLIVGATASQAGLEPWEIIFMSAAVFAGAAQFIALDMWQSTMLSVFGALSIIGSTLLVNLRHILMGAACAPYLNQVPLLPRLLFIYVMADENWALAMKQAHSHGYTTAGYLMGMSIPFYVNWIFWSYMGSQIGNIIEDPRDYGLDFVFTAVFTGIVVGFWRADRQTLVVVASVVVSISVYHLVDGAWYIFAGGVAGVVAAWLRSRIQNRRENKT